MTPLQEIQALSNERQALWRLAGKQKWTEAQRERVDDIGKKLARLWDAHRCEVAADAREHFTPLPTDRLGKEYFSDFLERQSGSRDTRVEEWVDGAVHYVPGHTALQNNLDALLALRTSKRRAEAPFQRPPARKRVEVVPDVMAALPVV